MTLNHVVKLLAGRPKRLQTWWIYVADYMQESWKAMLVGSTIILNLLRSSHWPFIHLSVT